MVTKEYRSISPMQRLYGKLGRIIRYLFGPCELSNAEYKNE